mmetsp:Transcript_5693/g.12652  ORF Transcript_5693/g.12652 Transcript_5693/m.12652 type:complete len:124 (-) Transcript_5693:94-465(-)
MANLVEAQHFSFHHHPARIPPARVSAWEMSLSRLCPRWRLCSAYFTKSKLVYVKDTFRRWWNPDNDPGPNIESFCLPLDSCYKFFLLYTGSSGNECHVSWNGETLMSCNETFHETWIDNRSSS